MFRGLRSRLLSLVAVALVPLAAFALAGVVLLAEAKRQDFERSMAEIVRALGSAVDNELNRSIAVAQALARSPALAEGDMETFYRYCQQVIAEQPNWVAIALSTPDGKYIFNTLRPLGEPLPQRVGAPQEVVEAARLQRPVVGDVVLGRVAGSHILGVRAPVVRDGQTAHVLSVAVKPESLQAVLQRQAVPEEATVAVLDRSRRIVARSRRHADFVGKPATASLQQIMAVRMKARERPRRWTAARRMPHSARLR